MSNLDKSKPIQLDVMRRGDHVAFVLGELVIGVEPDTARAFAEKALGIVGDIQGKSFLLLAGGPTPPKSGKRTRKV